MAKKKRITKKRVQASESRAFVPSVEAKPEIDEGPFDDDGLSLRQRQFAAALAGPAGGNATKAAEMAGYASENRNALAVTASRLLGNAKVAELVQQALARQKATPDWAKNRLIYLASSSFDNFGWVDEHGKFHLDFAKARDAAAIGQIREMIADVMPDGGSGEIIKVKIKTFDPLPAIGMLMKLHGLLRDIGPASADEILAPDPSLARAQIPPGTIPRVVPSGKVQDDPRGTPERKD